MLTVFSFDFGFEDPFLELFTLGGVEMVSDGVVDFEDSFTLDGLVEAFIKFEVFANWEDSFL